MNRASDPTTHAPVGEPFEPADGERAPAGAAIPTSWNTARMGAQWGSGLGGTIGHHVNPSPCPSPPRPPGRLSSTGGRNGRNSRALCALFFAALCAATTTSTAGRGPHELPQGKDSAMNEVPMRSAELRIEVRLDPQQAPARAELLLGAGFGQEARGHPIHGRCQQRRRRRRRGRAAAEDRRRPDAPTLGERSRRQALGQRLRQPAARHARERPHRSHRRARRREDRHPRRPGLARLPRDAERGRHPRPVDRPRPGPSGAGAR